MTKKKTPAARKKAFSPRTHGQKVTAAKIKDVAKQLGVNVAGLERNSKIKRTPDGKEVDLDESYKEFSTIEEARRYREEVDTNLRMVKLQQLRGELVAKDLVEKHVDEVMIGLRNEVLAINRKMAPELAAISDARQINRILESGWVEAVEATRKAWRVPEVQQ